MAEFTLQIDGMHCGSCIRRVSQALASAEGMQVEEVRLGAARLTHRLSLLRPSILPLPLSPKRATPRDWKPEVPTTQPQNRSPSRFWA